MRQEGELQHSDQARPNLCQEITWSEESNRANFGIVMARVEGNEVFTPFSQRSNQ